MVVRPERGIVAGECAKEAAQAVYVESQLFGIEELLYPVHPVAAVGNCAFRPAFKVSVQQPTRTGTRKDPAREFFGQILQGRW